MAGSSRLYHNPRLTSDVTNWRWVGENVGYGPSVASVHTAFMNSPAHKANILDRDYTEVGIGVVVANGRVWVAEVFRRPMRSHHHDQLAHHARALLPQAHVRQHRCRGHAGPGPPRRAPDRLLRHGHSRGGLPVPEVAGLARPRQRRCADLGAAVLTDGSARRGRPRPARLTIGRCRSREEGPATGAVPPPPFPGGDEHPAGSSAGPAPATQNVPVGASGTDEGQVLAFPASGEIIPDQRGDGRWMRVTWHSEADVVVLSLWRETGCVGTMRLDRSQVPSLVAALVDGLADAPAAPAASAAALP